MQIYAHNSRKAITLANDKCDHVELFMETHSAQIQGIIGITQACICPARGSVTPQTKLHVDGSIIHRESSLFDHLMQRRVCMANARDVLARCTE